MVALGTNGLRFIDDLITITNENFEKNIRNIYAAELQLKKRKKLTKTLTL